MVGVAGTVLQIDETFGNKKPEVWHEPTSGSDPVKKTKQFRLSEVPGGFRHCADARGGAYQRVGWGQ